MAEGEPEVKIGPGTIVRSVDKPELGPGLDAVVHKKHPEKGYIEEWRVVEEGEKGDSEPQKASKAPLVPKEPTLQDHIDFARQRGNYNADLVAPED